MSFIDPISFYCIHVSFVNIFNLTLTFQI
uniref:Uncharacterized protein n=1 Tax=Anguilla anguilla TaxID=7936 RepID=A0A0E9V3G0_ANGAN